MTHTSENVSCGRMKSDSSLKSLPRNVEIVTNALNRIQFNVKLTKLQIDNHNNNGSKFHVLIV